MCEITVTQCADSVLLALVQVVLTVPIGGSAYSSLSVFRCRHLYEKFSFRRA
jgi:hypothetical protein